MTPETGGAAVRALVVGGDAGYRERAEGVLGELGSVAFALAEPSDVDDIWRRVREQRADVVVLDATACETSVARVIFALAELAPQLGVVVVCEHLTDAARELHALPKWGWMRDLRAAVQRAAIDGSPLVRPRALPLAARRDLRGVNAPRAPRR